MNVDSATTEQFASSLAELDVPLTRTDAKEIGDVLETVVRDPAVGTALPFEGVSLPEWIDDAPTPATLEAATTGVTAASLGIADYGSVVLPARPDGSEQVSLFPERHVAVLHERDLVADVPTAIERLAPLLRDGESAIVATGPSATADMGALVRGAHGPKTVHVVLLEDGGES
ncbi:LUD domain-containing protein [Natrialbaceae archaeon AArc-T1-2]|uniref:LUD domain-containing protein n=1 Tax=Natrialbaceae archaeon AArc-T1-2 TaxID=3053904 RepID=UPI00255B163A|nr:LUD domain-containing protein [Natrialbaceae archaeon AArc-T1-2]WIV66358.1 LUD domain-containing protein [Natrialbaceae archaeon AArc-T1-2]